MTSETDFGCRMNRTSNGLDGRVGGVMVGWGVCVCGEREREREESSLFTISCLRCQ